MPQESSAQKKQSARWKRRVTTNHVVFTPQRFIEFRGDLPSAEAKRVKELKWKYGQGPFPITEVADDPDFRTGKSQHPQIVRFVCDHGNVQSESGFLFKYH